MGMGAPCALAAITPRCHTSNSKGAAHVTRWNLRLRDLKLSGLLRRISLRDRLHRRVLDANQFGWRTRLIARPCIDSGFGASGRICASAQRHSAAGIQGLVEAL